MLPNERISTGNEKCQISTRFWRSKVSVQFSLIHSLSHVRLFATSWTAARKASLSMTNSLRLLKLMPIKSVMPSNHLILCHPLLLLLSIFPSIRVFFNDPVDVGYLISSFSAFSKSSLSIWKLLVHVLLKPGLENFEHTLLECEISAIVR